jgi:hypothetical protein
MCLAVDVSGVYSGANNGQNVTVTLTTQDGMIHGQVSVGSGTLPLVGREMNGTIQGIWRDGEGHEIPFVAAAGPDGLQLQTNGVTYALAKGGASQTPVQQNQQWAPEAAPVNATAVDAVDASQLQIRQGQSLQCAVPAGWQFSATNNGVDTSSPDGINQMSHIFLRGVGRCTPEMWMQRSVQSWARFGITNIQVVSTKDINPQTKLYEMNYMKGGRQLHAMVQAGVQQGPGGFMAELIVIQSAPETFEQYKPLLITMAKSVRVTDANAFADGGKFNAEIQKRNQIVAQTQQEIGDMLINGERARSAMRDRANLGASDTLRDQTRWTDAGGQEYTAPLDAVRAFKHADGTVSYTNSVTTPTPSGASELNAYNYRGQ